MAFQGSEGRPAKGEFNMSICIIHLSDGKVAGVYSNTHEPMEVMVMERDGPRMTEEQQALSLIHI